MDKKEFCTPCIRLRHYMERELTISYGHINCREDIHGYTLLHEAIESQETSFFNILLAIPSIDLNIADKYGNTPLYMAIGTKEPEFAMRLLESNKCDLNKKNNSGKTPLMRAVLMDKVLVAHELLRSDADVNEQDVRGNTALHYSCRRGNLDMLCLLICYGANPQIKNHAGYTFLMCLSSHSLTGEFWNRGIQFYFDENRIERATSKLLIAIGTGVPLEAVINRGADVSYFNKGGNALAKALRYKSRTAFDLIWSRFNYQHVYVSSDCKRPLLAEFFYNELWCDWLHCYDIVSNSEVMQHAVQHYNYYNSLPPLISQVVLSFVRLGYSESDFFSYVLVLVSNGARVFLEDIETVYICCQGNQKTVKCLLDADVILKKLNCYRFISHPYIMLQVSRDVNDIFNDDYQVYHHSLPWERQVMFLPTLFRYCTPPYTFVRTLHLLYIHMEQYYSTQLNQLDTDHLRAFCTAYKNIIDPLMDNISLLPSLVELSRNATRNAICSWYNIDQYSEYRSLLFDSDLPRVVVNILLFRREVTNIDVRLPHLYIRDTVLRGLLDEPISCIHRNF